jgi:hypothetical protein
MGYGPLYFPIHVQGWLDGGWLKPGHALMDFGAQEFNSGPCDSAFLHKHGLPASATIREIYETLGIKYHSIDVDGAHGSTFFDLNTGAQAPAWRGAFDFVNNEGTIEHLVNPINGFHVAHEIAKAGAVIRHSFPLIGWPDHGFVNPTPKFYAHMIGDNGYELLRAKALMSEPTQFKDALFKTVIDETKGGDVVAVAVPMTNLWAELTYRKTSERPFVIPVDHVEGLQADKARLLLRQRYDCLARARPSGGKQL